MKSYTLLNKFFQSNLKVIEIFLYSNSKYTMYIIVYYIYYWQKTKFQLMLPMHEGDKPDVVYHSLSSDLWFSPTKK